MIRRNDGGVIFRQPTATTQTVIYRSKRHHTTKRNFEIFKATDFLAAVIDHVPPKSKHTVRY